MKLRNNTKGFSLMELLIVIIILGVLAGLAIPVYTAQVERARSAEALSSLQATREAMLRYFAQNGTYVGATIPAAGGGTIDYNPNVVVGGQVLSFSYALAPAPTAATFTIVATRTGGPVGTISIDQTGAIVRTGVFA